jgi:hypothetical protein
MYEGELCKSLAIITKCPVYRHGTSLLQKVPGERETSHDAQIMNNCESKRIRYIMTSMP